MNSGPVDRPPTLRALRESRGLSQSQLATLAGVAQATVSFWESGARRPGLEESVRAARALGVPLDEFARVLGLDGADVGEVGLRASLIQGAGR